MSISRLQASLAQATNDVTVAAANINFDFCLVKYEAPKEYRPIGKLLSTKRKQDAEHGVSHVTARRLAALFDGVCPKTPSLIEAYGARVSEISQRATDLESKECSESVFGLYTGVDATSIWAAATSSEGTMTGAIHVHLLACMLSSMFDAAEATSIWVELVEERRRAVALSWERDEKIPFSTAAAAAQQEMSRSQLADWDASARSWLQTADSIMRSKQTQLRLILKNVNLSMGGENKVFSSVIETWVKALQTMQRLIAGIPQEVQDGSAIIGLAAWHIYPNISVFGSRNVEVHMDDALVAPGGVLSLGCSPSATTHMSGVSWALSLTQYKYYGQPVRREGSFKPDPTRITFKELLLATLGAILSHWNVSTSRGETAEALRFIILLSRCASGMSQSGNHRIEGLRLLSKAADECLKNEDASLPFLNLGRNRAQFISAETQVSPSLKTNVRPFFGLNSEDVLLRCMHDGDSGVEFLRRIAGRTPGLVDHPCIIQYIEDKREIEILSYATVFESRGISAPDQPLNKKGPTSCHARWLHIDPNESEMTGELVHDNSGYSIYAPINRPRLQCVYRGSGETRLYHWYGDSETAGIYISKESRPTGLVKPKVTGQDLLWCLENDLLSVKKILQANDSIIKTMQYLSVAYEEAFETIDGPVVKVQTLEKPLLHANCITSLHDENSSHQTPKTCRTVSILAYLVAGHDIPSQRIPNNVFGVSVGDSIFVPNQVSKEPHLTSRHWTILTEEQASKRPHDFRQHEFIHTYLR